MSRYTRSQFASTSDMFKQMNSDIEKLQDQNKELKAILKEFITTEVDAVTWRAEMYSTIDEVINENL
mgnify:CR=1 FL=1|tara:strand:+ start:29387 stop:29587 length:201 start_codon:yes stop_codon:yes gene_type:complete